MFAFQLVPRVPPNTKVFPSDECQCLRTCICCMWIQTGPLYAGACVCTERRVTIEIRGRPRENVAAVLRRCADAENHLSSSLSSDPLLSRRRTSSFAAGRRAQTYAFDIKRIQWDFNLSARVFFLKSEAHVCVFLLRWIYLKWKKYGSHQLSGIEARVL